jgi:hypothetical protein
MVQEEIILGVIMTIAGVLVGFFLNVFWTDYIGRKHFTPWEREKITLYTGTLKEIDLSKISSHGRKPETSYELADFSIHKSKGKVRVTLSYIAWPNEDFNERKKASVIAKGSYENGLAYLTYIGKYDQTNEEWQGSAILKLETRGQVFGYFISSRSMSDSSAPFAVGEINVDPKNSTSLQL